MAYGLKASSCNPLKGYLYPTGMIPLNATLTFNGSLQAHNWCLFHITHCSFGNMGLERVTFSFGTPGVKKMI